MSAFFTLHRDLPREGPGVAEDVLWALSRLDRTPETVADIACGPGADLVTLARALPGARLTGIDRQPHFVEAARDRTRDFADRVRVMTGDMAEPGGPYDLIWCAGAVYFIGIQAALRAWAGSLAPGGAVAFSQPALRHAPASDIVRDFWGGEGHMPLDAAEIAAQVTSAGYRTRATRWIIGDAWANYYAPVEARIAALRPAASGELTDVLDDAAREIALWRAAPHDIAYLLSVVTPL